MCVFIFIQTNDNIMWLHKTYETGINIKSKDYKKGMSYIINLTFQLKQLDNEKKHNKPKISFVKKNHRE